MNIIQEFIPQALLVISAGGFLFLLGRKIPQSVRELQQEGMSILSVNEKTAPGSLGVAESFSKSVEKFLRRVKVLVLKSDAKLMELIKTLQKKRGASDQSESGTDKLPVGTASVVSQPQLTSKETFINKVNTIKKKLIATQLPKITSLRKEQAPKIVKREKVVTQARSINVEEGRRAMFEMREKVLIKRISLNPRNDDAYVDLGKLYRELGNFTDAHASFGQALKINKGNVSAKKLLKELEEKMPT